MDDKQRIERMNELSAMDSFARAREKHESKKRKAETPAAQDVPVVAVPEIVRPLEPKGKPFRSEALIEVKVTLPDKEIAFTLTKPSIYGNVPKAKLTEAELKRAVAFGLSTVMGAVR